MQGFFDMTFYIYFHLKHIVNFIQDITCNFVFLRIQRHHAEEFNFVPKTWILPADHSLLQNYAKDLKAKKKYRTFIVKPANGAQGHG